MYRSMTFVPASSQNACENLMPYIFVSYILDNARFLNYEALKKDPVKFSEELLAKRTELLVALSSKIPELIETIDAHNSPHVVAGSNNPDKFYEAVFHSSK